MSRGTRQQNRTPTISQQKTQNPDPQHNHGIPPTVCIQTVSPPHLFAKLVQGRIEYLLPNTPLRALLALRQRLGMRSATVTASPHATHKHCVCSAPVPPSHYQLHAEERNVQVRIASNEASQNVFV